MLGEMFLLFISLIYPALSFKCETGLYPPKNMKVPNIAKYVINLDLPPFDRWTEVAQDHKAGMINLLNVSKRVLKSKVGSFAATLIIRLSKITMSMIFESLPNPYKSEMMGISVVTGLPVEEVLLYNLFYEFSSFCTSIVARNDEGHLIHGRNLDFGGFDNIKKSYTVPEALKPMVIKLNFQRENRTVYRAVGFGGYVGLLTTLRPGQFSLSINARYSLITRHNFDGGIFHIAQFLLFDHSLGWLGFKGMF